ncbi:IS3 family transposase [Flavobacterium aurantiibacter]|uniref:Integrase n=1 Tax=Flavobacterium aurantiibacter TaxID=2023067 RepID=A0A256A9I9_9FLAO|nr:IS3 family transposase [Flavobacterium aurantiibacter]OYQ50367.1 integrase [Flavobacterium aurantiibacter]
MNQLYRAMGISKQAVHQYSKREAVFSDNVRILMHRAEELRKKHPGCGVEKMYAALKPDFIGRDRFVETFMDLGFRLKRKRNFKRTTYAGSIRYSNLIKGLYVDKPSSVWQSDITYIYAKDKFYYAVFIIDVYTKKIVGYKVSNHMRATANTAALQMALSTNKPPLIHHSDRGSQYTCKEYIKILKDNQCQISMSLTAPDNAYAERINRTIKEEYIQYWKPQSFEQLKKYIDKAVYNYNHNRPHEHLNKLTPVEFERKWNNNQLKFKPSFTIFDNQVLTSKTVNSI